MESFLNLVLAISALLALSYVWFGIPARMADRRGRNPFLWAGISFLGTPLLAIFLLYALDEQPRSRAQKD